MNKFDEYLEHVQQYDEDFDDFIEALFHPLRAITTKIVGYKDNAKKIIDEIINNLDYSAIDKTKAGKFSKPALTSAIKRELGKMKPLKFDNRIVRDITDIVFEKVKNE